MVLYKDLYGINMVLLLLKEHGDPSILFPNLTSYNTINQLAKFEENLSVGFYFRGMTLSPGYCASFLRIIYGIIQHALAYAHIKNMADLP